MAKITKATFADLVTRVLVCESMESEGPLISRTFLDPKTMEPYVEDDKFPSNDYEVHLWLSARKRNPLKVQAVAEDIMAYVRDKIPNYDKSSLRQVDGVGQYQICPAENRVGHLNVISRGYDIKKEGPPLTSASVEVSCDYIGSGGGGVGIFASYALDRLNVKRVKILRVVNEGKKNPIKTRYLS